MRRVIEKKLSFATLRVSLKKAGNDYAILVEGGESPHIGCTVLAVPRPSLRGDGAVSCTSSVLNVTGHKDEEICREIAETICKRKGSVVVCTGGFHADGITAEQIGELLGVLPEVAKLLQNDP